MVSEASFDTGQVKLHYGYVNADAVGSAPLVLLHGVLMSWVYWLTVIDEIGGGRRVFALDARGHGRSGRVENGYRFVDYPGDQQAFLREVVGEPAVLLGHSLGGLNAIYIAAETPELVRAVVLEDPPLYAYEEGLGSFEVMFRGFEQLAASEADMEEIAKSLQEMIPEMPDEVAIGYAQFLAWADPRTVGQILDGSAYESWAVDPLLGRIECPVQLLVGNVAQGGALSAAGVKRAAARLAHCETVFSENAGHIPHLEEPSDFSRAVNRFLAGVG